MLPQPKTLCARCTDLCEYSSHLQWSVISFIHSKNVLPTLCIATVQIGFVPCSSFLFSEYLHWFLWHWRCVGRYISKTTTTTTRRGLRYRCCLILWGRSRNIGGWMCTLLFHAVVSAGFKPCLRYIVFFCSPGTSQRQNLVLFQYVSYDNVWLSPGVRKSHKPRGI